MFSKIQQKRLGIYYIVDECRQNRSILTIKGWMCSSKYKLKNVHFLIEDQNKNRFSIKGKYGIIRNDVYQELKLDNAQKSGFYAQAVVENIKEYSVWIVFTYENKRYRLHLGKVVNDEESSKDAEGRIAEIESTEKVIDIVEKLEKKNSCIFKFPKEYYAQSVDIIVPVYNGYQYLEKLLTSIKLTDMNYRLILINDKSPDTRVEDYLEAYAKENDNVILLNNEENLGFVQTVNRGFAISQNHVALVNTDVELPNQWLERLMFPIFENKEIASTTPYTTCGTICSFPKFGYDNKLFLDLTVEQIDSEFKKIQPRYEELPTGVGFCMGINREVLQEIGNFDAKTFGKGYGE